MSTVAIRSALESALDAMPGIIPASNIVSSSSGLFTTSAAHGLVVGLQATIANHTGASATNGTYIVETVPSDTTFTLIDSVTSASITSTGTGGTVAAELTAWENMYFPVQANRVPYQKVQLMPARPDDVTMGRGYRREIGIFQVTLVYPLQLGTGDAYARAELIRSTFPRGASFTNSGIVVHIDKTPEIMGAMINDEAYMLPVRVYYYADIFN